MSKASGLTSWLRAALRSSLVLALGLLSPLFARAAFQDLGAGARAPGMGNAFVGIADDVYAIHYNPAGLSLLAKPEFGTSYSRNLVGLTDNSNLASSFVGYAHPLASGKYGTPAFAWEQFNYNSGLYQENSLSLGYGRSVWRGPLDGTLCVGATGKYLQRGLGSSPEMANAMQGLPASGLPDPVLSGKKSLTATDADLGFLYRLRSNYSAGLSILHVMEPNMAFGSGASDPVFRQLHMGLGYRSLISNVMLQLDAGKGPTGTLDRVLTVGAERWFPRLFVGAFALRGSLGLGSREYKQATLGLSYRTTRFGVDYGFILPINTIATVAGSHRFAFSVRFGGITEADESVVLILEAMRKLKAGSVPELQALGPGLSPTQKASLNEYVALANGLEAQAQYKAALDKLSQALALSPSDTGLLKNFGRLNFIAQMIKEIPDYKNNPVHAALHQGILAYLAFSDLEAIERTAHALSLAPDDRAIDGFLSQLELATGIKRPVIERAAPAHLRLDRMLTQAASALEEGRYDDVLRLALGVIAEEPGNLNAWQDLGTAYFATGDYAKALDAWQRAYSLEKDPARRAMMEGYLKSLRRLLARPKPARAVATAEPARRLSPLEIQKLYNHGVDYYTGGELEKAKQTFQRVLDEDPAYLPASKALRRVMEEMR